MFQVKICGITTVEDALTVAHAGTDAIGLNFYPPSPRSISTDTARQILAALPTTIVKVGLFVNADPTDVCRRYDDLGLDLIQLHGDEPPEYLPQLGDRPVMRAFRVPSTGLETVLQYLKRCSTLRVTPKLALLDALSETGFGGTGLLGDWPAAAQYAALPNLPPLVLAGGLTPSNVAAAIHAVHPTAVDVASGVESTPGRKDPAAVQAFLKAAHSAFLA